MLSGASTEMEVVDLHRAGEHVFPRHHEPQCMSHPPGRRLASAKGLGEPHRGQALIRLQQQPHGFQPDTQGSHAAAYVSSR